MSRAEPISTPSKNATSAMNRSGKTDYHQEAIKGELKADINNSAKCSFDAFLKHFLSLVVRKDSNQKKRLDELQTEIEVLQSQRYYNNLAGNGGSDVETAATDVTENTKIGGQGFASNEDPDDDTLFGTEKEKELVKERDLILDDLLHDALDTVLPIANNLKVKNKLKTFANAFLEKEPSRYGPYVLLCNDVLKRLAPIGKNHKVRKASIGKNLEVRKPDRLNIRFRRNDPKFISSHFSEMNNVVDRKPDVIITSLAAALHADGLEKENKEAEEIFSEKPKEKFEWEAILSSGEFKVSTSGAERIPEGGKTIHLDQPFENEGTPRHMVSHASLAKFDPEHTGVATSIPRTAEGSGLKRAREGEQVGEHSSPAKKQRNLGPELASGSKLNSVQGSAADRNSRMQANIIPKNTQEAINGRVQCASYALEMMSYSAGVHHAMNLLFTDDHIWIWYYDRQGILQSDGLSIFWNFPRFLVLLLALQRFTLEDWGVIRCLNPKAVHRLERKTRKGEAEPTIPEVNLDLQQDLSGLWVHDHQNNNTTRVEVNMNEFLSYQPHCLAGRATSVVAAKGYAYDGSSVPTSLVCKIYHPELQRRNEGLTLQVVRQIAKDNDVDMLKHLPMILFYGDVPGCTTQRIRSMVKRDWKGHRTLRVIGMKKLQKITTVQGTAFVKAWLETVICHAFLWKNHVEHGDPSLSNLMYDPDTQSGVLSDFDLSLLQWEPRIIGTERTGTVPFMAIDILIKEYWEGNVRRWYHHELESFIWILVYVSLLYDNEVRLANSSVDVWRTSNYETCREKKSDFCTPTRLDKAAKRVQPSYTAFWPLINKLCVELHFTQAQHYRHHGETPPADSSWPLVASQDVWDLFHIVLSSKLPIPQAQSVSSLLPRLQKQKPSFRPLDEAMRKLLQMKYAAILDIDRAGSALEQ